MKLTKTTTVSAAASVAAAGVFGILSAPIAFADAASPPPATPTITTSSLGTQAKLVDGAVVQGWTISDLKPSTDVIPHPVAGTLWEATATDEAIQGAVTPIVSNLNARAKNGQTYRALFGAATPQGVNPATLAPGQKTTGKVYFDVTGEQPDSVVYNAGGQDLIVWVQPPPSPSRSGTSSSYPSSGYPSASEATAAPVSVEPAPEGSVAAPAAAPGEVPPPAGSQGTPLPPGSQGTPLPAGSQGTPIPAGSQGTPLPAGTPGAPMPPGSQGTPLPPAQGTPIPPPAAGAPVPAGTEMAPQDVAPQPAGSQGTPLPTDGEQVPTPTTYTPAPSP